MGYALVLIAAVLWATMGLFYKGLMSAYALMPLSIVFWRATLTAVGLFAYLALCKRAQLQLARRDWLLFLGFGVVGVAAFYAVYILAIERAGMGVAAVLMYTAPVWVTLLSTRLFKEPLTRRKGVALGLALLGCALVGRLYALRDETLNAAGLLAGLGAGLTYGSYILFGKEATRRGYTPWTALAYALGVGAVCLALLQTPRALWQPLAVPATWPWLFILGLLPTLGGGVAFYAGLRHIPASDASIIATLEPVLAMGLGWAVWGEQLAPLQLLGAGLVLGAALLLQKGKS